MGKVRDAHAMPMILILFLVSMLWPSESAAWSIGEHRKTLTLPVLAEQNWTNEHATDLVLDCSTAIDLADLPKPLGFFAGIVYPGAGDETRRVAKIAGTAPFNTSGTDGFHFDDLFAYDDIDARWDSLESWAAGRAAAASAGWSEDARNDYLRVMGIVFHAVQDFYCHSNWAQLLDPFTESGSWRPEEFPVWEELARDDGEWRENHTNFQSPRALAALRESNTTVSTDHLRGGLQTGRWDAERVRDPQSGEVIKPWKHRHPKGQEKIVAEELARRATRRWTEKLIGLLPDSCRADLSSYVATASASAPATPAR